MFDVQCLSYGVISVKARYAVSMYAVYCVATRKQQRKHTVFRRFSAIVVFSQRTACIVRYRVVRKFSSSLIIYLHILYKILIDAVHI